MSSDSRVAVRLNTRAESFEFREKIFRSSCGRAYAGQAGDNLLPEAMEELVQQLLLGIIDYEKDPSAWTGLKTPVKEDIVVMTQHSAYLFEHIKTTVLIPLTDDMVATMGSGEDLAKTALIAGCSHEQAIGYALLHDRFSGGQCHVYNASDLEPLLRLRTAEEISAELTKAGIEHTITSVDEAPAGGLE
jgi:hypothetical protein